MLNNFCGGMKQALENDEYKNKIFFGIINYRNQNL